MNVVDRFLKYVSFDTTSDEDSETVPSTPGQLVLMAELEKEMKEIGLTEVRTETGYVYGVLPATEGKENEPVIGLIAHMDTSNAVSGADIKPRKVHYEGGDIILNPEVMIDEKTYPRLKKFVGKDLIVTDGTTLLGADDKAGIAEIMAACEELIAHPEIPHGKVAVCFTPDEEIGRGPDHFDVKGFGAEYAYTVDGGDIGELSYETFNAAGARILFHGVSIHPGSAKNKMRNAILMAQDFLNMMPANEVPQHTEGREGFYHVGSISGNETLTEIRMIIRDHDRAIFEDRKAFVVRAAAYLNEKYGEGTVEAQIRDSYYNMREVIEPCFHIVQKAIDVFEGMGYPTHLEAVRGGTDGSQLSFMGLPCPNLSTGGENCHGVREFVCIQSMEAMVEVLKKLVTVE